MTIPWQVETARIFGREMPIPRMTAWCGDGAYAYSGILHQPAPFPAIIDRLRQRAEALSGASFNAALANFYSSGRDSVGWHSDHEAGLGNRPTIASRSLGGERRFQFRHRRTKQRITLELKMGHWLIMSLTCRSLRRAGSTLLGPIARLGCANPGSRRPASNRSRVRFPWSSR
jgi:alkylated DNA repair dioxygenase AlkB